MASAFMKIIHFHSHLGEIFNPGVKNGTVMLLNTAFHSKKQVALPLPIRKWSL
jgi:hypothetical protein